MSDLMTGLLADLDAETHALRTLVEDAGHDGWQAPTPAAGWTVATQVAHLLWTDEAATAAASDRLAWDALVADAAADLDGFVDRAAHAVAAAPRADVLHRWDAAGAGLQQALRSFPAGERMPWFGPPMAAASMATARFMETWAHSLDVQEGLGVLLEPTDRMRHVAHLGVRTRGFAFLTHGLEVPDADVLVELHAPSGATWTWGPDDAPDAVPGSALDFCRLVTQRVHRDDTDLVATGAGARRWLEIAQAFAGPPGPGREPVSAGG